MSEQKTSGSPPEAIKKDLRARQMLEAEYNTKKASWQLFFQVNGQQHQLQLQLHTKNCKVKIAVS